MNTASHAAIRPLALTAFTLFAMPVTAAGFWAGESIELNQYLSDGITNSGSVNLNDIASKSQGMEVDLNSGLYVVRNLYIEFTVTREEIDMSGSFELEDEYTYLESAGPEVYSHDGQDYHYVVRKQHQRYYQSNVDDGQLIISQFGSHSQEDLFNGWISDTYYNPDVVVDAPENTTGLLEITTTYDTYSGPLSEIYVSYFEGSDCIYDADCSQDDSYVAIDEFGGYHYQLTSMFGDAELESVYVSFAVEEVPLPAAFWLFGSALAGLLVKRKIR